METFNRASSLILMKDFTNINSKNIIYKDEHFFMIYDKYPVNEGHILIISNEIRKDFFELSENEKKALPIVIEKAKNIILEKYPADGFNIGMNCGEYAGQTIFHFHCHLIPRYKGDMKNPRGGVRYVIPSKGNY